jgi:hypothetical protein
MTMIKENDNTILWHTVLGNLQTDRSMFLPWLEAHGIVPMLKLANAERTT